MFSSSEDPSTHPNMPRHSGSPRAPADGPGLLTHSTLSRTSASSYPAHNQSNSTYSASSNAAPSSQQSNSSSKKKYVCPTCDRPFTTSGHLARHARVHTGERNHKCPFPGCETRCSRQDNLQQHYRIHLSPGSRRTSASATRAAMNRALNQPGSGRDQRKRSKTSSMSPDSDAPPSLIPAQQSLGEAAASLVPEPPETPPPLVEARLPMFPMPHGAQPPSSIVPYFPANGHPDHSAPSSYSGDHPNSHPPSWEYRSQSGYSYSSQDHLSSPHPGNYYPDGDQPPSPASSSGSQHHSQPYGMPPTSFNTYPTVYESDRRSSLPSYPSQQQSSQAAKAAAGIYQQTDSVQSLNGHHHHHHGGLPSYPPPSSRAPLAQPPGARPQPSPLSAPSMSPLPSQPPTPTCSSSSLSSHIPPSRDVEMDSAAGSGGPGSNGCSPLIHRHSSDVALHSRYSSSHGHLSGTGVGAGGAGAGGYTSAQTSAGATGQECLPEVPMPVVNTFSVQPSLEQHHYPHSYPHSQSIQSHYSHSGGGHGSNNGNGNSATTESRYSTVILPPIHESDRGSRGRDQQQPQPRRRHTDPQNQVIPLHARRADSYSGEYDHRDDQQSQMNSSYTHVHQQQSHHGTSTATSSPSTTAATAAATTTLASGYTQYGSAGTSEAHYDSRGYAAAGLPDSRYRSGLVHQNS